MNHKWTIRAIHIKGEHNIQADALSRAKDNAQANWSLSKQSNQSNSKNVGKFSHDLFANTRNAKHDQFTQRFPLNATEEADAMNMKEWPNWALAHPPNILTGRVIKRVAASQNCLILVTPYWNHQSWFPQALQQSIQSH